MADINTLKQGLIVTAFWEAKPEEVDGARRASSGNSCRRPRREPGVLAFQIHQSLTEPHEVLLLRGLQGRGGVRRALSNATHFKTLILEQAVPRLAKRERTQHKFV